MLLQIESFAGGAHTFVTAPNLREARLGTFNFDHGVAGLALRLYSRANHGVVVVAHAAGFARSTSTYSLDLRYSSRFASRNSQPVTISFALETGPSFTFATDSEYQTTALNAVVAAVGTLQVSWFIVGLETGIRMGFNPSAPLQGLGPLALLLGHVNPYVGFRLGAAIGI